jgi:hypothetical protein
MEKLEHIKLEQIRRLTARDRVTLTNIFKKAIIELKDDSIKRLISSNKTSASDSVDESTEESIGKVVIEIGASIIEKSLDILNEDLRDWFCDLLKITEDEFLDLPFDAEVQIVEQIRADPAAGNFFTTCWRRANLMHALETPLKLLREKYDSTLAAISESS